MASKPPTWVILWLGFIFGSLGFALLIGFLFQPGITQACEVSNDGTETCIVCTRIGSVCPEDCNRCWCNENTCKDFQAETPKNLPYLIALGIVLFLVGCGAFGWALNQPGTECLGCFSPPVPLVEEDKSSIVAGTEAGAAATDNNPKSTTTKKKSRSRSRSRSADRMTQASGATRAAGRPGSKARMTQASGMTRM